MLAGPRASKESSKKSWRRAAKDDIGGKFGLVQVSRLGSPFDALQRVTFLLNAYSLISNSASGPGQGSLGFQKRTIGMPGPGSPTRDPWAMAELEMRRIRNEPN